MMFSVQSSRALWVDDEGKSSEAEGDVGWSCGGANVITLLVELCPEESLFN